MLFAAMLLASASATVQQPRPPATDVQVVRRMGPPAPVVTGDHASIPLEFTDGLPTFSAIIGGKPFKLGFDTGAPGGAHLTDRVVQALALEPVGEALAGDPSGKNLVRLKLYPVNDLELGPVKITKWIGSSAPVTHDKLESVDGIIGLGAFDGFVVTLDYAGRRLLLDRGALPEPDGKTIFAYDDAIPIVPLTIEGKALKAHLDTGNVNMPVFVPANVAERLSGFAKAHSVGVAHTISNTIQIKAVPVSGAILVGNVPLTAAEVGYPSVIDIGNVGSRALSDLTIRIDPKNRRIEILRPPARSIS